MTLHFWQSVLSQLYTCSGFWCSLRDLCMLFDTANRNPIVQSIINRFNSSDNRLWFSCPIPNTTLLQSPHPSISPVILGYQDIYILFHTDRFPLLKTITGSHFSQGQLFIGMPCQPTYQFFPPWYSSAVLFARWSMSLPKHQFLFLPFNYTNTLFTLYKLISPPSSML